jgi:hypothetical protein
MSIPKIQFALNFWEEPINMIKITQTKVDFEIVDSEVSITFKGVVQPLNAEALKIGPLEMRSWEWLMIHTRTSVELSTNDLVQLDGKKYKVMFDKNYKRNGYYEYHLVKNYE